VLAGGTGQHRGRRGWVRRNRNGVHTVVPDHRRRSSVPFGVVACFFVTAAMPFSTARRSTSQM
jgi:hypothetical protein